MSSRILRLLPFLFCALCACDNSKNNAVASSSEEEPALETFRKGELDTQFIEDSTEDIEKNKVSEIVTTESRDTDNTPESRPKPKKKRAVIVFDSLIYHLPEMQEGDKTSLELKFKNEGEAPLSIKEVDVVCGCTTPEVPFLDILPGEEGKIGIQYNSVGKEGLQEPEITVISNGIPRKTVLKIIVNVTKKKKVAIDSISSKEVQDSLP